MEGLRDVEARAPPPGGSRRALPSTWCEGLGAGGACVSWRVRPGLPLHVRGAAGCTRFSARAHVHKAAHLHTHVHTRARLPRVHLAHAVVHIHPARTPTAPRARTGAVVASVGSCWAYRSTCPGGEAGPELRVGESGWRSRPVSRDPPCPAPEPVWPELDVHLHACLCSHDRVLSCGPQRRALLCPGAGALCAQAGHSGFPPPGSVAEPQEPCAGELVQCPALGLRPKRCLIAPLPQAEAELADGGWDPLGGKAHFPPRGQCLSAVTHRPAPGTCPGVCHLVQFRRHRPTPQLTHGDLTKALSRWLVVSTARIL